MNGFIKFHRSVVEWEWYKDANTARVFFHLLLTANFQESLFRGKTVGRGQTVASMATIARALGLTPHEVRTALIHLEKTGEIRRAKFCTNLSPKSRGGSSSVISIVNYEKYQGEAQSPAQTSSHLHKKIKKNPSEAEGASEEKKIPEAFRGRFQTYDEYEKWRNQ